MAAGGLEPIEGEVQKDGQMVYCSQRTDDAPGDLEAFLLDTDRVAHRLRGQLNVCEDFATRWDTLSHGERKRAQLAVALWQKPHILAVDEPTNHLDLPAVLALEEALDTCRASLLLVSHDQRFLRRLTDKIWHIENGELAEKYFGSIR